MPEKTKKCSICGKRTYGIKCRKCYEKKNTPVSKRHFSNRIMWH